MHQWGESMWKCVAGVALGAAAMAACTGDSLKDSEGCMTTAPGVVVQAPGIDVQVRDPYGIAQAIGTTAIVHRNGEEALYVTVNDTLNIYSAFNIAGTFSVALTRPYYETATLANVVVSPERCIVKTTTVPVTLQLAPGAPALRSLVIVGADFLDHAGAQVQLLPHFDAEPSVSRGVTWASSDATLATVSATGLVSAACNTSGGTVKITATAAADPSISANVNIGVAPAASCP
jgi:hypothetical protein